MDNKVTLSFNADVISSAKAFAQSKGISLSRLIEVLLQKATTSEYTNIEDLPVADWVNMLGEGEAEYKTRRKTGKQLKDEFFQSKK